MQNFTLLILIVQPLVFLATFLLGILNSEDNGFNGMQAVVTLPVFFLILVCYFVWKKLHGKFAKTGNVRSIKLIDRLLLTICIVVIIIDLGTLISTLLTGYYINLFSFPPTITEY